MNFTLLRIASLETAVYGVLLHENRPIMVTLEDAWKKNIPYESCIPMGKYKCLRVQSPKFGNVWQIMDVPGRTHILIHKGNSAADTLGCLLLGEAFSPTDIFIRNSRQAFDQFMALTSKEKELSLDIINRWEG